MDAEERISSQHEGQLREVCRVLQNTDIRDLLDSEMATQQTGKLLMISRSLREFSQQTRAHASAVRQKAAAQRAVLEDVHILS